MNDRCSKTKIKSFSVIFNKQIVLFCVYKNGVLLNSHPKFELSYRTVMLE